MIELCMAQLSPSPPLCEHKPHDPPLLFPRMSQVFLDFRYFTTKTITRSSQQWPSYATLSFLLTFYSSSSALAKPSRRILLNHSTAVMRLRTRHVLLI